MLLKKSILVSKKLIFLIYLDSYPKIQIYLDSCPKIRIYLDSSPKLWIYLDSSPKNTYMFVLYGPVIQKYSYCKYEYSNSIIIQLSNYSVKYHITYDRVQICPIIWRTREEKINFSKKI